MVDILTFILSIILFCLMIFISATMGRYIGMAIAFIFKTLAYFVRRILEMK